MTENFRQRYIRLLEAVAEADAPVTFSEQTDIKDRNALWELKDGEFITGHGDENEKRQLRRLFIAKITVKGRRLLEEFEKEEALSTSSGFIKAHRFAFYRWAFGIVAALAAGYYLRFITAK